MNQGRHRTVNNRGDFPLPHRRFAAADRCQSSNEIGNLLSLVQLDWLADRYPHQLSGGQRQRIALARALAVEPRVLLLDEPFGALDAKVRKELRTWLRRLHDEMHITSVFVTHDQDEALEVSDRVVVMNEGRIQQIGTPQEVYDQPVNAFVYQFLGNVNLFHGRMDGAKALLGATQLPVPAHGEGWFGAGVAYARPHEIELFRPRQGELGIAARVEHLLAVGPIVRVDLRPDDSDAPIRAEIPREQAAGLALVAGDRVLVRPRQVRVFAA